MSTFYTNTASIDNLIVTSSAILSGSVTVYGSLGVNSNQVITPTQNTTKITGSFTGSFVGDGNGLTNLNSNNLTSPTTEFNSITYSDKFLVYNSGNGYISLTNLLTELAGPNLQNYSGQSLALQSNISELTSVTSTGFTGSLQGTASFATTASLAISSSYATTASYVLQAVSSSFATNSMTASYYGGTVTSASYAQTASYVINSISSSLSQNSNLLGGFGVGSFAQTGSNTFNANQVISGSLTITQNLVVLGSSSLTYITASQLAVSASFISVNVFEPVQRFGGLVVYDSGSSRATASFAWDSQHNHWIYQNASGSTYSGGMFIAGPANTGSLGEEPTLTTNFVPKSQGGDHITDSNVSDSGTLVNINSNTTITGSLFVTGGITGSLQGTATTASYYGGTVTSASFASTASFINTLTQNVTVSGSIFLSGSLNTPVFVDYEERFTSPAISAGTLTLNLANGNVFNVALNAAVTTLTISNPPASNNAGSFVLVFTADGTPRAVTWGASILWPAGTAPTLTSTNGKKDVFGFISLNSGTNWYGFIGGQNI